MSRRKLQWKTRTIQAGTLDKIIPEHATGAGEWLTTTSIDGKDFNPDRGHGEGAQVTVPMNTRKEQLVRKWAKES